MIVSESEYNIKEFRNYMNKLVELMKHTILNIKGEKIYITISVGVASTRDKTINNPVDLYKKADDALYKAKEAGKNCVR